MPFTAAPLITLVADNVVRLSAVLTEGGTFGLAAGDSGTIELFEGLNVSDVRLPEAFKPRRYGVENQALVNLDSSIQVMVVPTDLNGFAAIGYTVNKTPGGPTNFQITIQNTGDPEAEGPTIEFEIYIRFH